MFGGRLGARKRSTFYLEPFLLPRVSSFAERREPLYPRPMSSLQAEIERRGQRIFELVDQHPESIFSKAGFYQRMMALSMRDEAFQGADVSLRRCARLAPPLGRYRPASRRIFSRTCDGFVPLLQTGLRAAGIFPWLTAPHSALERFRHGAAVHRRERSARRDENAAQAAQTEGSDSRSICWAKRS